MQPVLQQGFVGLALVPVGSFSTLPSLAPFARRSHAAVRVAG